jgi:hypothetical protein
MKRIIYILILLTTVAEAQYPGIHHSRPRIYIDSSRFAWLHNNMPTGD